MTSRVNAKIIGWDPAKDIVWPRLNDGEHRPANATPVTDEQAMDCLEKVRQRINDFRVTKILDFVLSRRDVRIMYIGGDIAYVDNNGHAFAGCSLHKFKHFYPIELRSE